jgi:enoyl-CoA hydratase
VAFRLESDSAHPAVRHLRFQPEDRRGALTRAALSSLSDAIGALARDAEARVIALHGAGEELFASGAALEEIATLEADNAGAFADLGRGVLAEWEDLDATTVAVVRGVCYGGAVDLALASDLVVAFPAARFAHPGVLRGIVTGWGGTARARRRLSPAALHALFAEAEPLGAEGALANGLADVLLEDERSLEAELARWAGASGDALRSLKRVTRATEGLTQAQALTVEERMRDLDRKR